jgi:hypothetical protein
MGQRAEHEIKRRTAPINALDRDGLGQGKRRELREDIAHLLPGPPVGRQQRDLDTGMAQQEPHQLRARVARGTEHADFRLGGFRHGSILCIIAQSIMPG